jgi:hypothetical protein
VKVMLRLLQLMLTPLARKQAKSNLQSCPLEGPDIGHAR